MTDKKLTEIVLIVDRSGSMASIQSDAEGGINSFIEEQKKVAGNANLTLAQFDTDYDLVFDGVDIQEVEPYSLYPRGATALLDAIGKTINVVGARLARQKEFQRPSKVIVVIVTDGAENSSSEFSKAQINELITQQTDVWKWEFVYLAAGQDAIQEAQSLGISANTASNFVPTSRGISSVYKSVGLRASYARSNVGATMDSLGAMPDNVEDDELINDDSTSS